MACRVAALFSSRRETGPAASGDDVDAAEELEELEVDTHLHYVHLCTLRN